MRNDHNFIGRVFGVVAALALLPGCATSWDTPPPADAPYEPSPIPATEPYAMEPAVPAPALQPVTAAPMVMAAPPDAAVRLNPEAPLRYVVQKGDTLWGISNKFLRDSWQWPELWYVNPDVQNPHLIYPGDVLYLSWVQGAPRLARAEDTPDIAVPAGTGKLGPSVREMPLELAISGIPLDAIRGFMRGPRVVSKAELKNAPYVVDFDDERILAGAGDVAYVLGIEDQRINQYQVVHLGEEYRDPDDDDVIGYEALPVADSEVQVYGDPSTVYLKRSDMEARIGDHLLPADTETLNARFYPHAPQRRVNGRIISVYNGLSQIGQYQIVALNRGTEVGLEPGHLLSVIQTGRVSKDPYSFFGTKVQLPDVNAGTVMVFKVAPRLSYGLVMIALKEIHLLDKVESPDPGAR